MRLFQLRVPQSTDAITTEWVVEDLESVFVDSLENAWSINILSKERSTRTDHEIVHEHTRRVEARSQWSLSIVLQCHIGETTFVAPNVRICNHVLAVPMKDGRIKLDGEVIVIDWMNKQGLDIFRQLLDTKG